jgi:hypothetical protein
MMDAGKLVGGLAIAALVAAGPLWVGAVRGAKSEAPVPPSGSAQCLEPKDSMRRNHPALLADWREQAVRFGQRTQRTSDGREVRIGLEETCLGCHGEASQFCERCHTQVGVTLSCWQCHAPSPITPP